MSGFLARYGEALVKNGYAVIPIAAGTKRPPLWLSEWQKTEPSVEKVRSWCRRDDLQNAGVGVNLGPGLVAIDIDSRDVELSAEMVEWCETHLPMGAPVRVGFAPKTLLLYRCESPIKKHASKAFHDGHSTQDGKPRKAQLEVLGQGEQFVAYAIHPDTGRPYTWDGQGLLDTPAADLPVVTLAQVRAAVAAFEAMCQKRGWPVIGRGVAALAADDADWTDSVDHGKAANLTLDQLRDYLFTLPNDPTETEQDYDTWLQAGMAVYHQTDGSDEGYDIWFEWSSRSSKHTKAACEAKWKSFDVTDKDRRPITAKWLIKVAREIRDEKVKVQVEDVRKQIEAAQTEEALRKAAARAKTIELDKIERDFLASALQKRLKSVLNSPVSIGVARDMIRFERPDNLNTPMWLAHWVFIATEGVFYNRTSQVAMRPEAFDMAHARLLLTDMDRREGRSVPERKPSDMAMNVFQIKVVDRRAYLPSHSDDDVVSLGDGVTYVNTYSRAGIPEMPGNLDDMHRANLALIQQHCEWLLPDPRERGLLLSFLRHVVHNKRVRWSIVLHGEEGAGKTFFFEMMGHVLGKQNVRAVAPKELEKEFNGWAEGVQFICLEEIKMHGHNRYDVMNALKPLITNDYVSVRRMRMDSYTAPNTASYFALTNFADALPVSDRDRRYMMLSAAPTKADILAKGADYFPALFDAVAKSAGAVRQWLHELEPHPDFNPDGRAPVTAWKARAAALAESEEVTAIKTVLEGAGDRPGLSRRLLLTNVLADALAEAGEPTPATRALNRALMEIGLSFVGRVRVDGPPRRVWSDNPNEWLKPDGEPDAARIREWLDPL